MTTELSVPEGVPTEGDHAEKAFETYKEDLADHIDVEHDELLAERMDVEGKIINSYFEEKLKEKREFVAESFDPETAFLYIAGAALGYIAEEETSYDPVHSRDTRARGLATAAATGRFYDDETGKPAMEAGSEISGDPRRIIERGAANWEEIREELL